MTAEQAEPIIESILNQIKNPGERINLLKKMIPGAVQSFETFEITKARISQSLDAKGKCQIQKKTRRTKKST